MRKPSLNVLVLSDFGGYDANVVRDYLYCFNQHSRHRYYYLHRWARNGFRRLWNFDFDRFDAIVLFWDFFWIGADDPFSYCHVPTWVSDRIANARGVKIQFLQDEYREVRLANRVMNRFGVNLMFSCVHAKDHERFYPKKLIPSLQAVYPVLTGYVPRYLERVHHPAAVERTIDIGYRSRKLPYYLGRLGQEKSIVAERFQQIADEYGFSADISVREQDRIYGDDWLAFMRACRFSIGTESGASVVDFDGQIRKRCQEFLRENPHASFEEAEQAAFAGIDGRVVVQTISPRIFEAAAFENTLILHEGDYEGMLQPDVHYISVKKDYSNVAGVVERMKDRSFCERLAGNAKESLIASGNYSYQAFVKRFDENLESHAPKKDCPQRISRTVFYALNYVNNDGLMPHGGVCSSLPQTYDPVLYYNEYVPHLLVIVHSIAMIVSCLAHAPWLMAHLIVRVYAAMPQGRSVVGLAKDLRILALLSHLRRGDRATTGPAYSLQLVTPEDATGLCVRTVPVSVAGPTEWQSVASIPEESKIIEAALSGGRPFAMTWENRLMGDALPLPFDTSRDGKIYLDTDCEYRFEYLSNVQIDLSADEKTALHALLIGNWSRPSWAQKASAVVWLAVSVTKHIWSTIVRPWGLRLLAKLRQAEFNREHADGVVRETTRRMEPS